MADASNKYIVRISPHITLEADEREQDFQLKALVAFERIGDLAVNISHYANTMHDEEKNFSDRAQKELRIAAEAIRQTLQRTVTAFKNEDVDLAKMVEPLEEVNDEIIDYLQKAHMDRMTHGECEVFNGIQFQNILQNMERISDQCSDTAVYLLARYDDKINGDEHRYVHDLHHNGNKDALKRSSRNDIPRIQISRLERKLPPARKRRTAKKRKTIKGEKDSPKKGNSENRKQKVFRNAKSLNTTRSACGNDSSACAFSRAMMPCFAVRFLR